MKTISTKPNIKLPKVKFPQKPSVGIRSPKLPGIIQPLRFSR